MEVDETTGTAVEALTASIQWLFQNPSFLCHILVLNEPKSFGLELKLNLPFRVSDWSDRLELSGRDYLKL